MKVVTTKEMRFIEDESERLGVSKDALMENAGDAVARAVLSNLQGKEVSEKGVVVLAGPGNNGGDGLVAARVLAKSGVKVSIFMERGSGALDGKITLAKDAGAKVHSLSTNDALQNLESALKSSHAVIDALFGTGSLRPILGVVKQAVELANTSGKPIYSIDIASGLDADSGKFDLNGIRPTITFALGFPKIGSLIGAGTYPTGETRVIDIGIPKAASLGEAKAELLDRDLAFSLLPKRSGASHKGSHGSLLIVAGSETYPGAAILSASAAVRSGVGLVHLAVGASTYAAVAGRVPEVICHKLPSNANGSLNPNESARKILALSEGCNSVLIGPGLGQSPDAVALLRNLLFSGEPFPPALLDADCLNFLSTSYRWQERITLTAILTPHPGEMSRLIKRPISSVQENRLKTVRDAASIFGQVSVLKGAATLIADSSGSVRISPWVNSGLASGGTGDVLAGLASGLLAQMPKKPFDAAALGVYLHGYAGHLSAQEKGTYAMTAGDVVDALPDAFKAVDANGN